MFTLLVLSRFDDSGAGPRYRMYQYFDTLKKHGIKIVEKPLLDARYVRKLYTTNKRSFIYLLKRYFQRAIYLLFHKKKFDLVWMDSELFPFVPFFLERLCLPKKYIMDQDDAVFHNYDLNKSIIIRKLFHNKIDKIMKNSCQMIVGNSYLRERAQAAGAKRVAILPTVVDANKYKSCTVKKTSQKEVIIGWVGSPSTVKYFSLIETVLKKIAKQEKIILFLIGANYLIDGVKKIYTVWPNGWDQKEEIQMLNDIDIGIMPLENGPWEKGKCGFKLIQYMACAKPVIASPVGINLEIVEHGKNGFLASSTEEWEEYLLELIKNPEKRKQFGDHGRRKMLEEYSLQATTPKMCDLVIQAIRSS